MADTKYTHGRFVWHELATTDIEKSKAFYGAVAGWTYNEMPMPDGPYTMVMVGQTPQGGIFDIAKMGKKGVPPHFMPIVSVPNVDEAAAAAKSNGGTVGMEPMDVPGVGRMAVIGDPQHAYSTAFKSAQGDPDPVERPSLGMFCWDTLSTTDQAAATKFYGKLYGWSTGSFEGMTVFKAGDATVADMQATQPGMPANWMTFIVVKTLAEANTAVKSNGGKVMVEAMPIPNVGTISIIQDNVGAMVGLFEMPKE